MRLFSCIILLAFAAIAQGQEQARREAYLAELKAVLPPVASWEAWQAKTGELPPDFSAMPSIPGLPPLLVDENGAAIASTAAWEAHRETLLEQVKHYIIGSVPPAPDNLEATVLVDEAYDGVGHREVELRFGPDHKAKLWLEIFIPPGNEPRPVFMSQFNHRDWVKIAVRRGYIGVVYAGADMRDDTHTFGEAYPDYDWSKLTRRGWAASRCIDYLEQAVPEADLSKIALTGHSRNGKTSLMGAALDERISCVISSSSGAGGNNPTRLFTEEQFGEGIEIITRRFEDWFTPRWRFFVGREHKLPVDLHTLVALSAPRPCLIATAINDSVESTWAVQEAYKAVKPVYALYGAEDRFRITWRPNGHDTYPTVIETYVDWCDQQFGRGEYDFPERMVYPQAPVVTDPNVMRDGMPDFIESRERVITYAVRGMLGPEPPAADPPRETQLTAYGANPEYVQNQLGRDEAPDGLVQTSIVFGEYISGDIYTPADVPDGTKLPVVLWLHPVSNARGYRAAYLRGSQPYQTITRAGYGMFCFDQIGHGRRVLEAEHFYSHHPDWSLMGKTIRDARAAIDAIAQQPNLDSERIYVVGFAAGALTAVHLSAMDSRPAGYALVCPPAPFGLDANDGPYGGTGRWSTSLALLPRLAALNDSQRESMPFDLPELMGAMAPRPLLVVLPELGRESPAYTEQGGLQPVTDAYAAQDASGALTVSEPHTYIHFDPKMQGVVVEWLKTVAAPFTAPEPETSEAAK